MCVPFYDLVLWCICPCVVYETMFDLSDKEKILENQEVG